MEVALGPVEDAITNSGVAEGSRFDPAMDRSPHGEDVPMPSSPFVVSSARKLAESIEDAAE